MSKNTSESVSAPLLYYKEKIFYDVWTDLSQKVASDFVALFVHIFMLNEWVDLSNTILDQSTSGML